MIMVSPPTCTQGLRIIICLHFLLDGYTIFLELLGWNVSTWTFNNLTRFKTPPHILLTLTYIVRPSSVKATKAKASYCNQATNQPSWIDTDCFGILAITNCCWFHLRAWWGGAKSINKARERQCWCHSRTQQTTANPDKLWYISEHI